MRTVTWRMMAVLAVAAQGWVGRGAADDTFPPCWRGGPTTTFQEWTFSTAANPASPEFVANSFGAPAAAITLGTAGAGWINALNPPFGATRSGFWDLGAGGRIDLSIPNAGPAAGSWKFIHVQVTQYRDGIYNANASVSIPGAILLRTQTSVNQLIGPPFNGRWELQQTVWLLEPCPASETITVTAPASGSAIDQIVVDTQCSTGDSGDITVPCWRGQPGSTYQNWSFHNNADPAAPEQENNPGAPVADVLTGPLALGWQDGLVGFGCRQGYWDLGSLGSITMSVPNTAGSANSYKIIQVQVTEFQDSLAYTALADIAIPGATLLSRTQTDPIETTVTGRWVVDRSVWRIAPCPASETIILTAPAGSALVDQVVVDTLCIDVVCPSNVGPLPTDPGQCSRAGVSWSLPAVDGCKVTSVVCMPPNGSTFPVGVSSVACTIQDAFGGTFTCNFTVTVTDNQPPTANCPANLIVSRTVPLCGANVTYTASATDNCPGATIACVPASGSLFPLGVSTVNCTATDAGLLTGTCSFTVTVLDFTGDVVVPCWRGQPTSTHQHWTFLSADNPIAPDVANSPGAPLGHVVLGPLALGWQNGLTGFGCRQGYWDLGANGTISLSIPNFPGGPNSVKHIRVQVTRFKDSLAYVETPAVTVAGATLVSQQEIATLDAGVTGVWVVDETILRIQPCPASEIVVLTAPATSALVDQVVVDTVCQDISCPADISDVADSGQCSKAGVTWSLPAPDGCLILAVNCTTNGQPVSSPATFPVGVTTVNCGVTVDGAGTFPCTFTVTINDTQPPAIQCPANATVECPGSTLPAATGTATGTDNCGTPVITFTDAETMGCGGTKTIIRTWKATDAGGLMATCDQTIQVVDTMAPSLVGCPMATIDLGCNPPAPTCADALALVTATDACQGPITPACSPGLVVINGCQRTQSFLITAADACGNSFSCTVTYTWREDMIDPVLAGVPAGGDLGCNPATLPACDPGVTATDDCDGVLAVTCTPGLVVPAGCLRTQTFTYSATDLCGNTATAVVTYTWKVDTTAPVLAGVPAGADLGCNPMTPPVCAPGVTATDDCDGALPVTCTPGPVVPAGCLRTQIFTYSATDACGNAGSAVVTYTWKEDSTAPALTGVPAGGNLGCNPMTLPACDAGVTATDDCDGALAVTCTPGPVVPAGCLRTQTFTYSATDLCGNTATAVVTYTWKVDTTAPVLAGVPAGADLGCNPMTLPVCASGVTAADDCDGALPVTCTPGPVVPAGCLRTQTFTYSATDACGNAGSAVVTYTWKEDSTAPVLTGVPAGGNLGCNPMTLPACDAGVTGTDDCDGALAVTCTPGAIVVNGCLRTQTFTYAATDTCGNPVTTVVTYTWKVDMTPPVLAGVPAGANLGCNPTPPACDPGVTATDDCDGSLVVTCTPGAIIVMGCNRSQTFTYSAADGCGNTETATVTYTWKEDTTPPVLAGIPAGGNLGCNPTPPACDPGATATDDCDGSLPVTCTPGAVVAVGCNRTQTFTYSAADACGNPASVVVSYSWTEDMTPPVIGTINALQTRPILGSLSVKDCANPTLEGEVSISVVATDNCGLGAPPAVTLVNGMASENATFVTENPAGTYHYTWTVTTMTPNGTWTATVAASDCAATTTATFTLCVNSRQITGQIELEGFTGATRDVTFVATDGPGAGAAVLKTWTLTLSFSGGIASYTLTDVPAGTLGLSAKTAWSLRRKLPVTLDVNGQGVANFTGANLLKGGDMSGDNQVSLPDYSILAVNWFTANPVADITGDGMVNLLDYTILGANWFTSGDPQ